MTTLSPPLPQAAAAARPSERIFPARPFGLYGETTRIETPVGTAYVTVNFHNDQPTEVFITLGKAGSDERAAAEALARLCSISLQFSTPLSVLARQLRGISSENTMGLGPNKILSMPDAVGKVLEKYTPTPATPLTLV